MNVKDKVIELYKEGKISEKQAFKALTFVEDMEKVAAGEVQIVRAATPAASAAASKLFNNILAMGAILGGTHL